MTSLAYIPATTLVRPIPVPSSKMTFREKILGSDRMKSDSRKAPLQSCRPTKPSGVEGLHSETGVNNFIERNNINVPKYSEATYALHTPNATG